MPKRTTDPIQRLREFRLKRHLSYQALRGLIETITGRSIGYATLYRTLNNTQRPHETTRYIIEDFVATVDGRGRLQRRRRVA